MRAVVGPEVNTRNLPAPPTGWGKRLAWPPRPRYIRGLCRRQYDPPNRDSLGELSLRTIDLSCQTTTYDNAMATVTLVDDEPYALDVLERAARSWDFSCQSAQSAEQALELLEQSPTPVVVTDLRMP